MRPRAKFEGIIIARYGNINGPDELQNSPKFVEQTLKAGWHVCVEVVFHNGAFLLPHAEINGHSFTPVPPSFFSRQRVWACATNPETLDALCNINAHCFMFSGEQPTLTSAHFIWTPAPHALTDRGIAYLPETAPPDWLENCEPAGLCSDQPAQYI
jgi:hypothetical protein